MTNRRGPTIYFVWNYREWGGAQIYFLSIMKEAKDEWNIVVLLPRDSMPEILRYLEELSVPYEFLECLLDNEPAPTIARKIRRQWNRIRSQMTTYARLRSLDLPGSILHIELAPWQDWVLLSLLVARGANVFVTMHNFPPRTSALRAAVWKLRLQFVSRLPRFRLFTSNNDTKNRLRGLVSQHFWDRVSVTFTAVDPREIDKALAAPFDRDTALKTLGIPSSDFVVLCVGQFIDRKGRWVFLDAARQVLAAFPDVTFLWLTPQMPNSEDEARIAKLDLGGKFKLVHSPTLGNDRIDVLTFFRIADVFTLPSFVEGLPIALLEAMALERPSISTNVYAIPEAIKHLQTGILIEPGDSRALADAIVRLRNDAELRDRLAKNGREHVLRHFDERQAAATAIRAYQEVLDAR